MIYELRVSREDELLKALRETEGIGQIHLLIHDGEYRA